MHRYVVDLINECYDREPSSCRWTRLERFMRTLVFGAGPLGCLYAHRLDKAGKDVTILARGDRHDWIQANGLLLVDEIAGEMEASRPRVVDALRPNDEYDLVVVLIRKNKLAPVFQVLAKNNNISNILFMGNNALGFGSYFDALPKEKLLFGFPGAGGGVREHVVPGRLDNTLIVVRRRTFIKRRDRYVD